jgi:hypothetical protein
MRRSVTLALTVLSLLLPLAVLGSPASARDAERPATGLLITYRAWGPLHRGMTAKQAQRTGMVSTKIDHCAAGFQMTKRFRTRGWALWNVSKKPWTVSSIVVVGPRDHTREGSHPGTTLARLRRQHPHLSKVTGGSTLDGQPQRKKDLWVAWVKKSYGTIVYEFPYGPKPTRSSALDTIVVARKPLAYYGCRASSSSTRAGSSLVKIGVGFSTLAPTVTGRLSHRGVAE